MEQTYDIAATYAENYERGPQFSSEGPAIPDVPWKEFLRRPVRSRLGIAAGLFIGKQLGVFLLCYMAIKLGMAKLPEGAGWGALYGVAILSGVGFTMSLFIGGLAFENLPPDTVYQFDERLGILVGSLLSGVVGYIVLDRSLPKAG